MKKLIQVLSNCLPLFLLVSSTISTSAFYDPQLQRWVNRDPLGERGFEVLRRSSIVSKRGSNLYTALNNNPLNAIDAFGLVEYNPSMEEIDRIIKDTADAMKDLSPNSKAYQTYMRIMNDFLDMKNRLLRTPPKPPWWRRACRATGETLLEILNRLGRIPVFILDPCAIGDPILCPESVFIASPVA